MEPRIHTDAARTVGEYRFAAYIVTSTARLGSAEVEMSTAETLPTSRPDSHTKDPLRSPEALARYVFNSYFSVKNPAPPLMRTMATARIVKLKTTRIPTLSSAQATLLRGMAPPPQPARNLRIYSSPLWWISSSKPSKMMDPSRSINSRVLIRQRFPSSSVM